MFTIFELDRLTVAQADYLRSLDLVIVCTRWAKHVLLNHGIAEKSIGIVPLGVDTDIFNPNSPDCAKLTERDCEETVFLNIGRFELRKGHDILLEAFNLAFEPSDNVRLILHGWNHVFDCEYNSFWIDSFKKSKMGSRITVNLQALHSQRDVAAFLQQADCGVFPARAEGWNLGLLEMMALGKCVIATNYSGHTEFANTRNCLLLQITELEDAYDGHAFQRQGKWAKFAADQLEQLVICLRTVHSMKQKGRLHRNNEGVSTAQRLTWQGSVAKLVDHLSDSLSSSA